ncbi:SHOCT domain-containing protein [Streptomyces exfoliatus]|uniref:SHOCT domain-containing protein n=1 Tax=Streptomyces exfoliatus TaxID=1905 RepID=UPI001B80632E|nr:SHOCT domain-containing protein [Streptomyces exfoliatus]
MTEVSRPGVDRAVAGVRAVASPPGEMATALAPALADVKAQGLLTDEEFAADKARVLHS